MCRFLVSLITILALAQSSASAAEPPAPTPLLSPEEQTQARKIYVAKCAKCHEFYEPSNYKSADWNTWMTKMGRKSKLSADQLALLRRYTETLRTSPPPVKVKQ